MRWGPRAGRGKKVVGRSGRGERPSVEGNTSFVVQDPPASEGLGWCG